jgi:hypothetical protein
MEEMCRRSAGDPRHRLGQRRADQPEGLGEIVERVVAIRDEAGLPAVPIR